MTTTTTTPTIDWDFSIGNPHADQVPIFSFFNSAKDSLKTKDISINDYIGMITDPSKKEDFLKLRSLPADKYKKAKVNYLNAITGSCIVSSIGRTKTDISALNGLCVVDFDELPDSFNNWQQFKEALSEDEYSYLLHYSASARGLCLFVKIPTENHFNEIYLSFEKYYFDKYGATIDFLQDENRLRFISHDEDIFSNQNSKLYTDTKQAVLTSVKPFVKKEVSANGETPAEAFNKSGEQGLTLINNELSSRGYIITNGYGKSVYNYQRDKEASPKSIVAFYNKDVVLFCRHSANTGLKKETYNLYELFKELNGFSPYDAADKLASLGFGTWKKKKDPTEKKEPKKKTLNAEFIKADGEVKILQSKEPDEDSHAIFKISYWVKNSVRLKNNEVTKRIVFDNDGSILTEGKMKNLFLQAKLIEPKITKDLFDCIITGSNPEIIPIYNPFKAFIADNIDITTSGEFEALKTTIYSNTINYDKWIEKWYLGLFAAIDGAPVRSVLALLGGQNTGKTEWFRRLLPEELQSYYGESKLDREKDDELLMCEKLIINDDEMGGKSKEDEKKFKMLSSKSVFNLRSPYGRFNEDFKRLAVLCGTSNDLQIINDPTGNTRILGINVIKIDQEAFNKIDKKKLFIEGYKKYLQDKKAYLLDANDIKLLEASEVGFKTIAIEEELILRFLEKIPESEILADKANFMTATEIKEYLEEASATTYDKDGNLKKGSGTKVLNMKNFGIYLKKHFGESIPKYNSKTGNSIRVYYVRKVEDYRKSYKDKEKQEEKQEEILF